MPVIGLEHIQIAVPEGREDAARRFYIDMLGFEEVPRPASLDGRGGFWLKAGPVNLHIGIDPDFHPAMKAHPAFLVDDLDTVRARLEADGRPIRADVPLPGFRRFHTADPFGNRIELMQADR